MGLLRILRASSLQKGATNRPLLLTAKCFDYFSEPFDEEPLFFSPPLLPARESLLPFDPEPSFCGLCFFSAISITSFFIAI
jgi:hypothetical protein